VSSIEQLEAALQTRWDSETAVVYADAAGATVQVERYWGW